MPAVEPLGVVRAAEQRRRRLWGRLLPPPAGLAMLYPMIGQGHKSGASTSTPSSAAS